MSEPENLMPQNGEYQRPSHAPIVLSLLAILGVMATLVTFSVPLYQAFCKVTGYGGTTQVATDSTVTIDRMMTVRFNADVDKHLPWVFRPMQNSVEVQVGKRNLIKYYARNETARPLTGHAVFNVTPLKAGIYFSKVQCFCFTEQTLQPGEEVEMPVDFFVDPDIADDPNLDDVHTITLSYTFYLSDDQPETVSTISKAGTGHVVAGLKTQ
jgi:cytochrome c oxidase assembly protein subunit 11